MHTDRPDPTAGKHWPPEQSVLMPFETTHAAPGCTTGRFVQRIVSVAQSTPRLASHGALAEHGEPSLPRGVQVPPGPQ